jgi:hypothetical protein
MRLVGGRPRLTVKLRIEAHGPVLNLSSPILKSRVDLRLNRVGATPNRARATASRANPTPNRAEATPDGFDLGADQARRIDVDQRNGVDADLLVSRRLVPHRSQRGEIVEDVHPSDHPVGPQHRRAPGHFGVKGGQAFIQPGARDPSGTADVCEFSPLAEPRAGSSPRVPSRFAYPLGKGSVPTTADAAYASRPASRSQAADGEARTRRRDDAENQAGEGRHSKGPGGEEGEEAASQHGRNESRR